MEDCIYAVSAADENYALPLAVTIRSALDTLAPGRRLHWFLVDGGFEPATRRRLLQSWNDPRLTVNWLQPKLQDLAGLPVSGHVSRMTYVRTLLPLLLPAQLERVLYLDADLLICRDLGQLWDEPLAGAACLACLEVACPCMDASLVLPNFSRCEQHLVASQPVPNYAALGIDPAAPYFNAGVLSVDLRLWRQSDLTRKFLDCLRDNQGSVKYWDQYALNVVLVGQWRPLDGRWNQGEHLFHYPDADHSPIDETTFERLRSDPWIVHFTSERKPWHRESEHPFRPYFWQAVDRTQWRGWRPETPYCSFSEWVEFQYGRYRQWRKGRKQLRKQRQEAATQRAA